MIIIEGFISQERVHVRLQLDINCFRNVVEVRVIVILGGRDGGRSLVLLMVAVVLKCYTGFFSRFERQTEILSLIHI